MTNISQELLHIGFCNLVQVLWIICCFMWKRTRFLLLILPLISSLFFLSYFQISKTFISLFSGTEWHTKLKLGPHMDSRLMNYLFLYLSFFSVSPIGKDYNCFYKIVSTYLWWLQPGVCELCSIPAILFLNTVLHLVAMKCHCCCCLINFNENIAESEQSSHSPGHSHQR